MATGCLPKKCIEQLLRIVPFEDWRAAYVACSGSYSLELALQWKYPSMGVYSNDVSLYTTAIAHALLQQPLKLKFHSRLEFIDQLLGPATSLTRAAAVMVAQKMAAYAGDNAFSKKHFAYYQENFLDMVDEAEAKLSDFSQRLVINEYFCGDWSQHIDEAIQQGAGIVAFPPVVKGEFERLYKFLDANCEWTKPTYPLYDPKQFEEILTRISDSGADYCLFSDQLLEKHEPTLRYAIGRSAPLYCYASTDTSSLRHLTPARQQSEAFVYTPIDLSQITEKSKVEIVVTDCKKANFIKDIYLAKNIQRGYGILDVLVYIDGMLAGCFGYQMKRLGAKMRDGKAVQNAIYLLADVSVSREARLSKLICTIATSATVIALIEKKLLIKIEEVWTTAWSKNPSSMKYRGVFEMHSRKETPQGFTLEYMSEVRQFTPQQIYKHWFKKSGRDRSSLEE